MRNLSFIVLGILVTTGVALGQHHTKAVKKGPTFKDVSPTIKTSCIGCHSGAKPAHQLDLSSYAKLMKGDKEGKVVIAGNPAKSRFAMVLHGKPMMMPPGGALDKAKVAAVEAWIKAGAKEK